MTLPHILDTKAVKSYIQQCEYQHNDEFFDTKIDDLQRQRAELFSQILIALWQAFDLTKYQDLSLNAVGGFGRQTLHPRSDIDICILSDKPLTIEQEHALSSFLTKLWDLGVDIGYAVRTEQENIKAAAQDVTIATNLLDITTLCGKSSHAQNILERLYANDISTSKQFFHDKVSEQQSRHNKAKNTALYLEPNMKNNPGGMRDVQTIIWIARKHFHVDDAKSLRTLGFLTPDEYQELMEAYQFVCRVRWALHVVAKRASEDLLFEHQADVAKFMGFGHGENAQLAVEKMMRQLFRAMTRIRELNQMMLSMIERTIFADTQPTIEEQNLDEHFVVRNNMIQAKYDEVFFNKANVLKLFRLIAEHQETIHIAPETLRLLRQTRRSLLGELQDYQACRKEFLTILRADNGLKHAFSLMHRYGVLASYFPEWKAIEGQMQFDMHNAYTVDEHAFKLLQHLDSFSDKGQTNKLAASVFNKNKFKHILAIAGLCHDLSGKQTHEANDFSALHAKEFALLHGLKNSEVELIYWLVTHQNLLTSTAQTRDINEPEVIQTIAKRIGTETKLNALYCFTVADLMATNDQSWNEWQESLLNELYFSLREALKNGVENIFEQRVVIRENKAEATSQLISCGFTESDINELWSNIPSTFFSSNQVQEIIDFSHQILVNKQHQHIVSLMENPNLECNNLLVYSQDRNMLFVDLFNNLSALKIRVKEAQLYKTKNGNVLEVIKILDHNNEPITDNEREHQVLNRIEQVLEDNNINHKPKQPRHVGNFDNTPDISFLPSHKKNRALLKVNALNNPLFIEKICEVFRKKQLTVHSARISTLGESAENVFSISTPSKDGMTKQEQHELVEMLLNKIA
ncbi:[protein-PII] uridylyltransferase [Thalassotalea sp. LPB0316]|uniref:[protein-PII] uridylyltransferase n=1 Tax=Thalassotalea sp. LPB0316 TaxID=2769490 RepID=UPI0018670C19|nr:[protein-PII] uridylyltransferase [Thalassotalea sp. LPB0316]QOL25968.1 [protein-PII] uridylyltransferase [Thalassotalea sp. LPB0316]